MKQLHPRAVWLLFFSFILRLFPILLFIIYALVLGGAAFFEERSKEFFYSIVNVFPVFGIIIGIVLYLLLCYFWAKLSYRFYRYELTENGFHKESGVIYKKYVTIPYDRIQNVDIDRGIWARILGLSDLKIQTAGASGVVVAEGRLPGLSRGDAERLRDELIHRAKQSKNQGL